MNCENPIYPLLQEGSSVLVILTVRPDAKRNRITKVDAKSIHIDIKAPPADGRANSALFSFFSDLLELPIDSFLLKKGHSSHKKILLIKNSSLPDIVKKLNW